jgi:MurNAc alpha-1-phosphate uridylyltransferase
MKALILAAGYGKRMLPLTEKLPKPLLEVQGKPLIVYHIENLANAGIREIVINVAHLGHKVEEALGDGSQFGVHIQYSHEGEEPLETGGGMTKALPLLGEEVFLVVNGDIYCDFDFSSLHQLEPNLEAHLILVDTPDFKTKGDFALDGDGFLSMDEPTDFTYAGIALYHPRILDGAIVEKFSIVPRLRKSVSERRVQGTYHTGKWSDVGTPERLFALQ